MSLVAVLAQAAVLPDTIVTLSPESGGWRVWLETLTELAHILIAVVMVAISAILLGILFALRRLARSLRTTVGGALQRLEAEARPVLDGVRTVTNNAAGISDTVRRDFEEFNETITAANERLNQASALAEERIARFNALLEVMQQEAEDLFIGTASSVRGMKAGAAELRRFRAPNSFPNDEEYPGGK